ncbi:MAG: hypothetical protein AB1452_02760 [Pseudomonadota bacterium]
MEQARTQSKPPGEMLAFLQSLAGFAIAVLVMLGVGGTVYYLVAPGGWIAGVFGRSLAGGLAALLAFLIIGVCVWLVRGWIPQRARNRYSELFVYAFAGAGLLYVIELLMKGSF